MWERLWEDAGVRLIFDVQEEVIYGGSPEPG